MLPDNNNKLKERLLPKLWYKYFHVKKEPLKFDKVQFPNVKKPFG